jgi:hypothetical protein
MRQITLKIAPGETAEVAQVGNYVRIRSALVTLRIENPEASEVIEADQGDDFQFSDFQRLRISHRDATEQEVKLIVSMNKKAGSSQVGGSVTVAGQQGAFTQGRASVTNANQVLLAANANRKILMIQNNDPAGTLRVRLDGGAADASKGFRIGPGDSLSLDSFVPSGAINAFMETASSVADNVEFSEG